jgi:transcriptional regulator with XRE-family HTH domain
VQVRYGFDVTDEDRLIGTNLARLRASRSQAEVAVLMKDAGWKWSQTTVWKVESGERPLRLTEARALAEVLHVTVDEFFETPLRVELGDALNHLDERRVELRAAVRDYEEVQTEVAQLADRIERSDETGLDPRTTIRVESALRRSAEDVVLESHIRAQAEAQRNLAMMMQDVKRLPEFEQVEVVAAELAAGTRARPAEESTFWKTLTDSRQKTREQHYGEHPTAS